MSEAIGASVGSVAISAAPSAGAAIGPSMEGEISMSGIGFDNGSPIFSGLSRMDSGLGDFSVNEGSRGPVSFTNSTDLFAETRDFRASIGSVPEIPVMGNLASTDVEILARNPNVEVLNLTQEKAALHGEFEPFMATMPINEGPAPLSLGSDFVSLTNNETQFVPEAEADEFNIEAMVETFVSSETEQIGLQTETIPDAIEDMRVNDPLAYMQLESDLRLVQNIVDLATEEADSETSTAISNAAINVAVERSGLIESIIQTAPSEEAEAQTEAEAQPMTANVQAIMESLNAPSEEVTEPRPEQPKAEFYVDEEANSARRTETAQAIKTAFEQDADPVTGKVSGKSVVDRLSPEPTDDAISEIRLKEGSKSDGSEVQRRADWELRDFDSPEQAYGTNEELIARNNAVTDEKAIKKATLAEAVKVRSGVRSSLGEVEVFPLAA